MGLFDKVKQILFDEDVVEIPVEDEELPERENKHKEKASVEIKKSMGFRDYGNDLDEDEVIEEDDSPIKKVVVPKEDEEVKKEKDYSFPIIDDYDEIPTRSKEELPEVKPQHTIAPRRDYSSIIKTDIKVKAKEEKDYHKILDEKKTTEVKETKKPFTVTPVISPVFGYMKETEAAERELISVPKVEVDPNKPRTFGPVSYNDSPLPGVKRVQKEEIVEVKKEILDLTKELPVVKEEVRRTEIVKPTIKYEEPIIEEDDEIISTPNYDDIEEITTSGIENQYIGNNTIEDAFEDTREFESIDFNDKLIEEEIVDEEEDEIIEEPKTDDIIEEVKNDVLVEDEEDAHLDDTIETDLFNLIDSMYKLNDEDDEVE